MSAPEVLVCADIDELARKAADEWVRIAGAAIAGSGRFAAALSGGNTPRSLYAVLAGPGFRDSISWDGVHLFWGDERAVPADHPDSNYRSAYETLLSKVPIPERNIHRIETELGPEKAAAAYEDLLRRFFALSGGASPRFDLILLGVGEEGHTASLFPGGGALREEKRLAVAAYVDKLKSHRITLTLPVLNHAANVFFLVSGQSKAKVVKEILGSHSRLPAAEVQPANGRLLWLLDTPAAALL
jgi:6-phosphogluconolactonase